MHLPEVIRMSEQDPLHNKYSLVRGAARRARQLQNGAAPLTNSKSTKACRVAQDEIRQGHVTYTVAHKSEPASPAPEAATPDNEQDI